MTIIAYLRGLLNIPPLTTKELQEREYVWARTEE
jgi:hypothetical protein